jgi:tetrapyrrole methylase family protein/MazG family protein
MEVLAAAPCVLARTERHPAVAELRARGIAVAALDGVYQAAERIEEVYPRLVTAVLERARVGDVVYAVPGHPLVGEESGRQLLTAARAARLPVRVLPAISFVDAALAALAAAGEAGGFDQLQLVDAAAAGEPWWDPAQPALFYQVDDAAAASRAKLALMERYPDEHPVALVRHAGIPGEEAVLRLPLYELDRPAAGAYDHLTSIYVPPVLPERARPTFRSFVAIIARLRAPDGCPWDREQDRQTLKRFVLEEAYELLEAVDSGDPTRLCDELGDLMIQVLMYAQFAREEGEFDIQDVIGNTVAKLVRRHPHVFGDVPAATTDEVLRNWDQIKRAEHAAAGRPRESALDGVPRDLPALMKATEVSKRAVRVGFEWPALDDVFAKLQEEVAELREAIAAGDQDHQRDEIGDLLFTVVNLARWLKIDPEEALRTMVHRFTARFQQVERLAAERGQALTKLGITELDALWEEAKRGWGEGVTG